jgi:hypothetical protein
MGIGAGIVKTAFSAGIDDFSTSEQLEVIYDESHAPLRRRTDVRFPPQKLQGRGPRTRREALNQSSVGPVVECVHSRGLRLLTRQRIAADARRVEF